MAKEKNNSALKFAIFAILFAMLAEGVVYFGITLVAGTVGSNIGLTIISAIFLVLSIILLSVIISKYNKIVRIKHKIEESLSLIDIQLKLRFDLIPNLVATVKGYSNHEEQVFKEISRLRNLATKATDEKEKLDYANKIVPKMMQIVAIAESYPELKADALYKSLMDELVLVEDKIVAARRFFDSNVQIYNTTIEVWPTNLIAKMFGFARQEMFKIDAGERLNVKVNLSEGE